MKASAAAMLVLGTVVALAGLTFSLQGLGFVGPPGSFMFENPTWVTQGGLTLVVGLILVVAAVALNRQGGPPKT
ncbi:MAG: hypothetical protein LYZ66_05100 [Nitrososphaerales archaeon]|nr:hypothetical protein [Nitrososphaerales archaeon]